MLYREKRVSQNSNNHTKALVTGISREPLKIGKRTAAIAITIIITTTTTVGYKCDQKICSVLYSVSKTTDELIKKR